MKRVECLKAFCAYHHFVAFHIILLTGVKMRLNVIKPVTTISYDWNRIYYENQTLKCFLDFSTTPIACTPCLLLLTIHLYACISSEVLFLP